jgi:predicted proteasome-type protease
MDNIAVRTRMRVFEKPGDRVICILSSGNLSLTQAIMALIDDDLHLNESHPARSHRLNRPTLYEEICRGRSADSIILCYKTDSLQVKMRIRLEQNDPYLQEINRKWQDGIARLVRQMPVADFSKTALGFAPPARRRSRVGHSVVSRLAPPQRAAPL